MTNVERFVHAVNHRIVQSYNEKTGRINFAPLSVLLEDDVARLQEGFRLAHRALEEIKLLAEKAGCEITHDEAVGMLERATLSLIKIDDLFAEGSLAEWGDNASCYNKTEEFSNIYDDRGDEE